MRVRVGQKRERGESRVKEVHKRERYRERRGLRVGWESEAKERQERGEGESGAREKEI